jgi:uncharacterized protein (TIGR04141 family)
LTQKLSIRLLRNGVTPDDAVRDGVKLSDWRTIEGAKIVLDTMGGGAPKWARFLELSEEDERHLINVTAFGLVFVSASDRWFAVSFGLGHVKLDPASCEQDFGLRIVLNTVDPLQLKSTEVRTPDENTLSRRSQTSRGSDQTAFSIDIERDIVRGLAGRPKSAEFANRVAGSDALSMDRNAAVTDLPKICAEALAAYQADDYKANFAWIDQIRHIRDQELIGKLDATVVDALKAALNGNVPDTLHLAFPVIYDPEKGSEIRYKGFRSTNIYPDLDIAGYLDALHERGTKTFEPHNLSDHSVHEVDDEGRDCGGKWKIRECIIFETEVDGEKYVLSGGRWYLVDPALAQEVADFFAAVDHYELPEAEEAENESKYNKRIATGDFDLLCLDQKTAKPTGASSPIGACDFLTKHKELIHVKDQTSSSRLSHLFNQGTVSARVLKVDGPFRDRVRQCITAQQKALGLAGFDNVIPSCKEEIVAGEYTTVYAVLTSSNAPQLPFFSLVTFRQAARELQALGYKYAFAWIKKPVSGAAGRAKSKRRVEAGQEDPAPARRVA